MSFFIENSLEVNNDIYISNKIKNIDNYFVYFFPIHNVKTLDQQYNPIDTNDDAKLHYIKDKNITYKLLSYYTDKFNVFYFSTDSFQKNIYHVFYSLNLLHKNNISYIIPNNRCFIVFDNNLPLLHNFSQSFYFLSKDEDTIDDDTIDDDTIDIINNNYLDTFNFINNPYISLDLFLISFLKHHKINTLTQNDISNLIISYKSNREIIDKSFLESFFNQYNNFTIKQIIESILKYKYTWSYYSMCLYFLIHYESFLAC